ncbi:nicotinate-nucleotide adenylyltransferase [bacterium]|nr:nicotinate-nucleotide adenylyltransferase [bacterium]
MRIGVFGGTFDPVHLGHLRVAEEVAECCQLERVIFIPSGIPPHRRQPETSAAHRLNMVRCAISGNANFSTSPVELQRPGKSYTIDTLIKLSQAHPKDEFYLIIGADQMLKLKKWYQSEQLFEYCRIVAVSRPGTPLQAIQAKMAADFPASILSLISFFRVSALDISSTKIRKKIRHQKSVRYLVPKKVSQYIELYHLYQKD